MKPLQAWYGGVKLEEERRNYVIPAGAWDVQEAPQGKGVAPSSLAVPKVSQSCVSASSECIPWASG